MANRSSAKVLGTHSENSVGKLAVYMQKNETRPLLFSYKGPTENNQISD